MTGLNEFKMIVMPDWTQGRDRTKSDEECIELGGRTVQGKGGWVAVDEKGMECDEGEGAGCFSTSLRCLDYTEIDVYQ